ncbi:MAG TPA: hypothetical protein VJZ04_09915 [Lachnospiraceae bacterium]|nr:hypothetical protein [Lachnospiraceae bacterium]
MKRVYRLLFVIHAFVGIGAMAGGMMAILYPKGPGGMLVDALNNSPFTDYLIPGIILFAVIGLGNVFCAVSILLKSKYQGYISSIISWALVIWIIVQCIMLRMVVSLHVIFFIIGLIEAFLSVVILFSQHLFPTDMIYNIVIKLGKKFPNNIITKLIGKLENN